MIIKTIYWMPPEKDCYGHVGLGDRLFLMKCDFCGEEFESSNERRKYCCASCTISAGIQNRKERKAIAREMKCMFCGETFLPPRNDAKYCSDKCKQAAYRVRRRELKESKTFLLECFRLPADERTPSPLGYFHSSLCTSGAPFDSLIETWENIPSIKDNVKIVKYTKYECVDRQKLFFRDHPTAEYPFLILSNDSVFLTGLPMCPGDPMMDHYLTSAIISQIEKQ